MFDNDEHIDWISFLHRDEIRALKSEILASPTGQLEVTKLLQKPETRIRALTYPTTRWLYRVWTLLGFCHVLFLLILPIVLFFLTSWYWSVVSILFDILVIHRIHAAIKLELFARIWFTDKLMWGGESEE